jgi:hypothetical protein
LTIEVLYTEGCPHRESALNRVKAVLRELGLPEDVIEVRVADPNMAYRIGFPGSPTVRIDGLDVEPASSAGAAFACRTYLNGTRCDGAPSVELIRRALEQVPELGQLH